MWVLTRSDEGRFVNSWNRMRRPGVAWTMRLALVLPVAAAVLAGTVAASATPQPVARIVTGAGPCGAATGFGSVWVANDMTNMLYRIDPRRRRIVARIPVANWPAHVAAAFGSVWVSAYERGTVARVDPRRNRVSRAYGVGGNPSGLAETGGALWIAFGRNGSSLGQLDPKTGTLTKSSIG